MSPISKFEAIGIFVSVAVMAVALGLLNFRANTLALNNSNTSQAGAIVVATDNPSSTELSGALLDAATDSGKLEKLVIDDVRVGTGVPVKEGDTVTVHYIGSTRNGVQFDSSYVRGEPFTFTVGGGKVIQGWEQGLVGMKVGGQRILVIPPELAYGNRQVGPIPPNSPLVFAIELLEIK